MLLEDFIQHVFYCGSLLNTSIGFEKLKFQKQVLGQNYL